MFTLLNFTAAPCQCSGLFHALMAHGVYVGGWGVIACWLLAFKFALMEEEGLYVCVQAGPLKQRGCTYVCMLLYTEILLMVVTFTALMQRRSQRRRRGKKTKNNLTFKTAENPSAAAWENAWENTY